MKQFGRYQKIERELLAKIHEAEHLIRQVKLVEGEQRYFCLLKWATTADDATALIRIAEEVLTEEELHRLQRRVNEKEPGRWQRYKRSSNRFEQIMRREQPDDDNAQ